MTAVPNWAAALAAGLLAGCSGGRELAPMPTAPSGVHAPVDAPAPDDAFAGGALAATGEPGAAPSVPPGWLGGTASAEVARDCASVADALFDPAAYWVTFANTRAVEPLGRGPRGELLVTMEQGFPFATGRYTAHVLDLSERHIVAWVDPLRNVRDGRAEFSLTELDGERCHLAMFMAADLGRGPLVRVFGNAIEGAMLMTPDLVRHYLEQG